MRTWTADPWHDGTRWEIDTPDDWIVAVDKSIKNYPHKITTPAGATLTMWVAKRLRSSRDEDTYQECRRIALNDSFSMPPWAGKVFIPLIAVSTMLIYMIKPFKELATSLALRRQRARIAELRAGVLRGHVLVTASGSGGLCRGYATHNEWHVYLESRGCTANEALDCATVLEKMRFIDRRFASPQ